MPVPLQGNWTLRQLVQNTYHHMRNRFDYMERDVVKQIRIKQVSVYDGKAPGQARTKYVIESRSYPQYAPYFTKKDMRGRSRRRQRTYRHQYDVIIQLDKLSIDVPVKLRTGAQRRWRFGSNARRRADGRVEESENVKLGLNGDFWFRLQNLYAQEGILYGKDYTNGPAKQVNPAGIVFLDKHALHVVKVLMDSGVLV